MRTVNSNTEINLDLKLNYGGMKNPTYCLHLLTLLGLTLGTSCSGLSKKDDQHRENLKLMLDGLVLKTEPESKACSNFTKSITQYDGLKFTGKKQALEALSALEKNPGASESKKEISRILMNEDRDDLEKWGYGDYLLHTAYCSPLKVWSTLQKWVQIKKTAGFSQDENSKMASVALRFTDEITSYPVPWTHLAIAISVLEDLDEAFKIGKKKSSYKEEIRALKKETQDLKENVLVKIKNRDGNPNKDQPIDYVDEVRAIEKLRKRMRVLILSLLE